MNCEQLEKKTLYELQQFFITAKAQNYIKYENLTLKWSSVALTFCEITIIIIIIIIIIINIIVIILVIIMLTQ